MSIDHHDTAAIDAFADDVDRALEAAAPRVTLWTLVVAWVAIGGALTLAQGIDAEWLYPVGLVGVVLWAVGLFAARRPARWWNS